MRPVFYKQIDRVEPGIAESLAELGVATVVEGFAPHEAASRVLSADIVRRTSKGQVAGPVITVENAPGNNVMLHPALAVAGQGDVLVVRSEGSVGAQIGDLLAEAAAAVGVAAVIVDGPVRDLDQIDELGIPVWARCVSPLGARKDVLGAVNAPIVAGGVYIEPGDIAVADGDGIVIVPRGDVNRILTLAQERQQKEVHIRELIEDGVLPGHPTGLYEFLEASDLEFVDDVWGSKDETAGRNECDDG